MKRDNVDVVGEKCVLVEGPSIKITTVMVSKAIKKMKSGKAAEPSGNNSIIDCMTPFFNQIVYEGEYQMTGICHISSTFLKEKEMLYLVGTTVTFNYRNK